MAQKNGEMLSQALMPAKNHPLVGDISQVGLLAGIELVCDKATRKLFGPEVGIGARVVAASQRHGLIHRGMGDRVAFAPPFIINETEIQNIGNRFIQALDDVWAETRSH